MAMPDLDLDDTDDEDPIECGFDGGSQIDPAGRDGDGEEEDSE